LTILYLIATTLSTDPEKHAIDINTAKPEDLVLLPDVGRRKAHAIIDRRPIRNLEELALVIGKNTATDIFPLVRFSDTAGHESAS
jgi:DNA uptake protein ComE-like DNA-binding protein